MTAQERMLKGKYYVHACDELRALSRRCREFMYEFNFSGWDESDYRNKLIKKERHINAVLFLRARPITDGRAFICYRLILSAPTAPYILFPTPAWR